MIRSFKVRLYPTKEQEELMWKHINCYRFIWNYMLALQNERYKNGEKYLSFFSKNTHTSIGGEMNCYSIYKSFFSGGDKRWQIKRINSGYIQMKSKKCCLPRPLAV